MVCAFTGHRPEKLPWGSRETDPRCCALKIQLDRAVRAAWEAGATVFACGLARGCDVYFAEAVLRLQEQGADLSLEEMCIRDRGCSRRRSASLKMRK